MKFYLTIAGAVICAFVAITVIFGSWYTIDQGELGIVTRNGRVIETADPGLHFKMPWIDSVKSYDMRQQKVTWGTDKTAGLAAYTRDNQQAVLAISVNYRLDGSKVKEIYTELGTREQAETRILAPQVIRLAKDVFGTYSADLLIRNRGEFGAKLERAIMDAVDDNYLIVESVQIENIDFDDTYEAAIRKAASAQAEVTQKTNEVLREAQERLKQKEIADAAAYAIEAKAKAEAQATILKGDAEAKAIEARGRALRENKGLVELQAVEKWNGVLPATQLPGSALPFIGVK